MPFGDRFSFFRRSDPTSYRLRQDEAYCSTADDIKRKKQCYSVPSSTDDYRREHGRSSSRSSLLEAPRINGFGSNRFLSFIYNGFHRQKLKNSTKLEIKNEMNVTCKGRSLQNIIPIPIKETSLNTLSKTLFHKVQNSNIRTKPLIVLSEKTKINPLHASILPAKFAYCVEILSMSSDLQCCYGEQKYKLTLPSGVHSLGQTYRIGNDDENEDNSNKSANPQAFTEKVVGYIFSCNSTTEQQKWINKLTRVARPNQQHQRRKEISLNLWLQEAKNVPTKKRYFCEIYLDGSLYARTTTKMMGDMLFWGEEFNLCNLEEITILTLLLWKSAEEGRSKKKKSQRQLICQINIATKEIDKRSSVEKWYSPSSNYNPNSPETPPTPVNMGFSSSSQSVLTSNIINTTTMSSSQDSVPMLRVKAKYQRLDVLPLRSYSDFINFLNEKGVTTLTEIEPYLKVKAKEDLAQNLVKIIHKQGTAVPILCDLIINEISKSDDKNLILRGNTMASKAMEIYLKLIGEKYLQLTLSDFINRVLLGQDDCEVYPQNNKNDLSLRSSPTGHFAHGPDKSHTQYSLLQRQESLMMNVDMVWAKIMSSSIYFPRDLKTVFITLRQRLTSTITRPSCMDDQPDLCDRIISACIFLRYICPAILTPSLFGLLPEYPDNPKVTRTFTLVAKCIQTLANFSNLCGTKETYMVFMNKFIENNFKTMRDFLREISEVLESDINQKHKIADDQPQESSEKNEFLYWENFSATLNEDSIDLALCLATLHRQMEDCFEMISPQNQSSNIESLREIFESINKELKQKDTLFSPSTIIINKPNQYKNHDLQDLITGLLPYKSENDFSENITSIQEQCHTTFKTSEDHKGQSFESRSQHDTEGSTRSKLINQVDKEWKKVLSASYAYKNRSKEMFFASDAAENNVMIKSSNSSGYQTLSRSTDTLEKPADIAVSLPKSPSLPLKPSVKKCKQIRHPNEIYTQENFLSLNSTKHKNNSQEESKSTKENIPRHCTTIEISSNKATEVAEGRSKLVYSTSLPAFQSYLEYNDTYHPSEFKSAFREYNKDEQILLKSSSIDGTSAHLNEGLGPQEPTAPTYKDNNSRKLDVLKQSEVMKRSLDNLRLNFNVRMKRLLLADRTTIKLELERVKLMKRVCFSVGTKLLLRTQDLPLYRLHYSEKMTSLSIKNRRSSTSDSNNTQKISVKKYLDLAENVLSDAYNTQMNTEDSKTNIFTTNMEDLMTQIFKTNDILQNTLMSRSGRHSCSNAFSESNFQGSINKKEESIQHVQRSESIIPNIRSKKSSSSSSLMTTSCSGVTVQIIDQV